MELEDKYSKSSIEEADRSPPEHNDHGDMGIGRSHECVFCKRGFTTAQALGGHMNIHRKDRANNKAKPNSYLPPSSSGKVIDTNTNNNYYYYGDLIGNYYSPIPSHKLATRRGNYYSNVPNHEVIDNYHPIYLPPHASGTTPSSHVQDWRKMGLSWYTTNPFCVHESNDKIQDNSTEEGGLDLELRLGYHP